MQAMSAYRRWSEVRPEIVERLGEEALTEAHERTQAYVDEHRLDERH